MRKWLLVTTVVAAFSVVIFAAPTQRPVTVGEFAVKVSRAIGINSANSDMAVSSLRKLGVNKIVVFRTATGWEFDGVADIGPFMTAAPGVARIPGDQVNMHVEDALTGRRTDVDPDIVAIGLELSG